MLKAIRLILLSIAVFFPAHSYSMEHTKIQIKKQSYFSYFITAFKNFIGFKTQNTNNKSTKQKFYESAGVVYNQQTTKQKSDLQATINKLEKEQCSDEDLIIKNNKLRLLKRELQKQKIVASKKTLAILDKKSSRVLNPQVVAKKREDAITTLAEATQEKIIIMQEYQQLLKSNNRIFDNSIPLE